jgi:hypothetical protein
MNKKTLAIISILIAIGVILMSACTSATSNIATQSVALSTATRLALGTLKLDGTDQAVTQTQAAELLTLWEGYQSLGNSDTSSQLELDALMKQIQGTMTADQLKAIEAIDLTEQSVNEVLQSQASNSTSNLPASTPSASTLNQAAPAGGPGGMPPDGGGTSMGDITGGITGQTTPAVTQFVASNQSSQVNGRLLAVLIQMLETRSQASG